MFPDCTAPETAIPAAELPTDQLIWAKMSEAATSVSVNFSPFLLVLIDDRVRRVRMWGVDAERTTTEDLSMAAGVHLAK